MIMIVLRTNEYIDTHLSILISKGSLKKMDEIFGLSNPKFKELQFFSSETLSFTHLGR